jgi:dTDP-4-amino-4,6-dideoxygalactose transaminase
MSDHHLRDNQGSEVEKGAIASGPHVIDPIILELEAQLARYCGVKHAVACASAADALLMALKSYDVGPGDAIMTTPLNDTMALEVIRCLGATPVFVDIDQSTFNIDPEQLEPAIEAVLKGDASLYPLPGTGGAEVLKLRGIISTDLFGMPADYDMINAVASKYSLFVIEDGSHAFGSQYKGRFVGSLANIGITSFTDDAPLTAGGKGGMCFTNQDHTAQQLRIFRGQDVGGKVDVAAGEQIGSPMDEQQAAALLAKVEMLPIEIRQRHEAAALYTKYMDENPLLITPYVPAQVFPSWASYVLLTESDEDRKVMLEKLKEAGFPPRVLYAKPLYLLAEYTDLQYREGDFPVSEDYAQRMFDLPIYADLNTKDQEKIADLLNDWQ